MATTVKQKALEAATNQLLSTNPTTQTPYTFSFTPFLRTNNLATLLTTTPLCPTYASTNHCPLGRKCPNRHPTPSQNPQHHYGRQNDNYVCKHWLKGLCKKGDACDYLHEYNLRKMSECQFFNQNGYCQNGDECLYVHVKEDSKLPMCEDYNAGFCGKGPRCGKRHVRRRVCAYYMVGFCPEGKSCGEGVHLRGRLGKEGEGEKGKRERVVELERREDERAREGGWRDRDRDREKKRGRGGGGGRWRDKRR